MNDEIREQLSALADDELGELEHPLLLGRMQRDAALRDCLGRYQLIGEVMRGAGASAGLGIAQRVQEALADDTPVMASRNSSARWWKPLAGLAVAASVALVAVLVVTTTQQSESVAPVVASADVVPEIAPVSDAGEPRWDRIEPQVEKRLSGYLVNHSEFAASRGIQGAMPYARVVSDTHE